ncbi:hypothetical protein GCK72_015259 [Caenorhabditis remanei]|uniref:Cyclic nucleotide-binding domain-containing protein n=1 Tax=Caenorhabditis remanei TaxID=31234 RepID=A0A6A5GW70_CAERE|nr:hypothetical protein GCK72_015259 [Caenorhabditis remanei]KAF1758799.1 hypothetical protein GCK72_015259 [Caenorhabditis remanei]
MKALRYRRDLFRNRTQRYVPKRAFETIGNALRLNTFLRNQDATQIEKISSAMYPVEVQAGAIIIRQGDLGSIMYVIQEGKVQVVKDNRFVRTMERELFSVNSPFFITVRGLQLLEVRIL